MRLEAVGILEYIPWIRISSNNMGARFMCLLGDHTCLMRPMWFQKILQGTQLEGKGTYQRGTEKQRPMWPEGRNPKSETGIAV